MRPPRAAFGALALVVLASSCSLLAPSDADLLGGGGASGAGARDADGAGAGQSSGGAASAGASGGEISGGSPGLAGTGAPGGAHADAGDGAQNGGASERAGAGDDAVSGGSSASRTGGAGPGGSASTGDGAGGEPGTPDAPPLDGLVLWLDAEHGAMRDEQDGVELWVDRASTAHDASQNDPAARPRYVAAALGGRAALAFDGGNDALELPADFADFTPGLSFFAVFELQADANCPVVLGLQDGVAGDDILMLRRFGFWQYELGADYARGSAHVALGVPHLLSVIHDPTQAVVYEDRVASGSHGSMPLPPVATRTQNRIGQGDARDGDGHACLPFEGLIGELLLYRRALDSAERVSVEAYLTEKWQ